MATKQGETPHEVEWLSDEITIVEAAIPLNGIEAVEQYLAIEGLRDSVIG
jgi:hypothetical protein